jgi:predicted secreted hydrolase
VIEQLSAPPPEGFLRAIEPRSFSFPADHGPHEGFRTEWWYLTGNLRDASGRRFGYELTIFRSQLVPKPASRRSAWATNQVYMAHFAITDVAGKEFFARERFARDAQGLAGAGPRRVWVEDWTIEGDGKSFPARLKASEDGRSIELKLRAERPVVLNGDKGLSRKGAYKGDASYYYSIPRIHTEGSVAIGG